LPAPLTVTIVVLQVIGLAIVLRLRVVEPVSLVTKSDHLRGLPA
jgi:hypothetical protein